MRLLTTALLLAAAFTVPALAGPFPVNDGVINGSLTIDINDYNLLNYDFTYVNEQNLFRDTRSTTIGSPYGDTQLRVYTVADPDPYVQQVGMLTNLTNKTNTYRLYASIPIVHGNYGAAKATLTGTVKDQPNGGGGNVPVKLAGFGNKTLVVGAGTNCVVPPGGSKVCFGVIVTNQFTTATIQNLTYEYHVTLAPGQSITFRNRVELLNLKSLPAPTLTDDDETFLGLQ